MTAPEVCDLSADDPPFNPALWIKNKRTFPPAGEHFEVHAALEDVLRLPHTHSSLIPEPNLPIAAFLELSLPKTSSALVFSTVESWFSGDPPTTGAGCLLSRPVPPVQFLEDLSKAVGQAWVDGSISIIDPRYNDGRERFPLSALTLWKKLSRVLKDQKMWQQSRDWTDQALQKSVNQEDKAALTTARSLLDTLGWDTRIHGPWTTLHLSVLLSNAWLSDDHIDMMMADLSARVAADPELAQKILIAPLAFSQAVKDSMAKKTYQRKDTPLLARYEDHIKAKGLSALYFPVHIHGNHWIAGMIDFKQALIGTGDSRVKFGTAPHKFIQYLKRWLKKQFRKDFVYQGDSLEHGDQRDSSSCAVVARNTVAAGVFGEALWEQEHAAGARATCFIRLVRSAAIREMKPVIPPWQPQITEETPAEISVAVAIGDHNFPDLAVFALQPPTCQSRPTLADLMNPATETAFAETQSKDVPMLATELGAYAGDHGDVFFEGDLPADERAKADDGENSLMDIDDAVNVDVLPAARKDIFSFFGKGTPKTKPQPFKKKSGKRSRNPDSDLDESVDAKKPKKANGTGTSKSAVSAQKNRDALKSGELTVATADVTRYGRWKDTLRTGKNGNGVNADPKVVFHPTDVRKARHSVCGDWVLMGEAYDCTRWNSHLQTTCPRLNPGKTARLGDGLGGVPTLQGLGWGKAGVKMEKRPTSATRPSPATLPCPGITAATCPRLPEYLKRPKIFGLLTDEQKDLVVSAQRHEWKWITDHAKQRIFSTDCKKQVLAPRADGRLLPCIPDGENYIYVNEKYRNQELAHIYARTVGLQEIIETADAKNTPCIKFALGTLEGKYTDFKVFSGLVEAMVQKVDRVERGVGMQNFKYPPAWDEIAHIINIHSPRAAKALREHIPLRTQRSFRAQEAREPRFPMVLEDERIFLLIQEQLAALKYDGPLGLSCDDTKLFAGLRLYHDKIKKADFLVGGVDGPLQVANPEEMKRILADPTIQRGSKVRLWCLTIPLPGITPLIVAAIPIHDHMSADELLPPLEKILYGLLNRNIRIISYACDGTETERLLQRTLVGKAEKVITHKIRSPSLSSAAIPSS
ncbi:hypothetical protein B0H14DRAFT_3595961 [Mycena olivaceomarginata]|nr:hypothetical protein B0H14DRAFT_3595961 [Mycena olivaceomarginata]